MNVIQVLEAARARVAKGWCQDVFARDSDGGEARADGQNACSWCAEGAIGWAPGSLQALITVERVIGNRSIVAWNDEPGRTQSEVLDAFTRAIALARSAQ